MAEHILAAEHYFSRPVVQKFARHKIRSAERLSFRLGTMQNSLEFNACFLNQIYFVNMEFPDDQKSFQTRQTFETLFHFHSEPPQPHMNSKIPLEEACSSEHPVRHTDKKHKTQPKLTPSLELLPKALVRKLQKISMEDLRDLRDAFLALDSKGTGILDANEFAWIADEMCMNMSESQTLRRILGQGSNVSLADLLYLIVLAKGRYVVMYFCNLWSLRLVM